jgi:hypothetical protein
MTERLRITVCGYIVRGPLGGLAWHHLQYVLGLSMLGHDVVFVEDSDDFPGCYNPSTHSVGTDPAYGIDFLAGAMDRLGLGDRWGYFDGHTDQWLGPLGDAGLGRAAASDVLLDLSAVNPPRSWWADVPVRVHVDTDPAFTQLRHLADPALRAAAEQAHTAFLTFGENVGAGATIPDDGLPWRPTRQPVVLDAWPVVPADRAGAWTTVMQWDSYAERSHGDVVYGMKSRSFDPYVDLPSRLPEQTLALAVGNVTAPRDRLSAAGWQVLDPLVVTRDPWTHQDFVQRSKGEFGVAKQGYVVSNSGWFSERTAGYLASGRPAVVQDSGFASWLPTGEGIFAFSTPDEAVAAIQTVDESYERHCVAAREVAAAYFDHRAVLNRLLDDAVGA